MLSTPGDNRLGTLEARFPSARRLLRPSGSQDDPAGTAPDDVTRLIESYLDWVLLEVDSGSTDILIGEPEATMRAGEPRQLLILGGEEAQAWLRNVRKSAQ